jgi:hypothetical protein
LKGERQDPEERNRVNIPVPRHCHNHHSADPGGLDLAQTGLIISRRKRLAVWRVLESVAMMGVPL